MAIGIAGLVLLAGFLGLTVLVWLIFSTLRSYSRKAREGGYPSLGEYLRAAPRSDEERRDAVDLALKGLVLCILGLLFPPFLLVGVFPVYYGARKLAYSSLGFGLVEDVDPSSM